MREQRAYPPATPEQLDAAAEVAPEDMEAARAFWSYWGTPLLNAMLNAKAEPEEGRGRHG